MIDIYEYVGIKKLVMCNLLNLFLIWFKDFILGCKNYNNKFVFWLVIL